MFQKTQFHIQTLGYEHIAYEIITPLTVHEFTSNS